MLFAVALLLQFEAGAYRREVMVSADDPAHFISGLMIRDYLVSGFGQPPLEFAYDYYAHYPKVAIGNWPPLFYVVQALWLLVFPAAPGSILLLLAVMAAATAWIAYRMLWPVLGLPFAAFGGALFLLLHPLPSLTRIVMAEVPVTLACAIAVSQWVRFAATGRPGAAVAFAACAGLAVLTKPNALLLALVPPLAIVLARSWHLLRVRALWWASAAALLGAGAWVWHYLPTMQAGWQFSRRLYGDLRMLGFYPAQLARALGVVPLAVAVLGVGIRLRGRGSPDWAARALWTGAAATILATLLFHALAPAGHDRRHLLPAYPFVAMFLAAGAQALANRLRLIVPRRGVATGVVMALVLTPLAAGVLPGRTPRLEGFGAAAGFLTAAAGPARPVVALVSSDSRGEGAFVVEMALRDPARPTHTVWRGSKLLARSSWGGRHYSLQAETDSGVITLLERAAIDWVVLDRTRQRHPHEWLLEGVVNAHPDRFVPQRTLPLRRGRTLTEEGVVIYEFVRPAGETPPSLLRQRPGYGDN